MAICAGSDSEIRSGDFITAWEVIEAAYNFIGIFQGGEKKILRYPARGTISKEGASLGQRKCIGYIEYKSANIIYINGKIYALALGTGRTKRDNAPPISCDIAVVEVSSRFKPERMILEEIRAGLSKSSDFSKSIVFALEDGNFKVNSDKLALLEEKTRRREKDTQYRRSLGPSVALEILYNYFN